MDANEYLICIFCGGELSWSSTEMAADVYPGEYEDDGSATVNELQCRRCGRMYEVLDPTEEERETDFRDYWDGRSPKE